MNEVKESVHWKRKLRRQEMVAHVFNCSKRQKILTSFSHSSSSVWTILNDFSKVRNRRMFNANWIVTANVHTDFVTIYRILFNILTINLRRLTSVYWQDRKLKGWKILRQFEVGIHNWLKHKNVFYIFLDVRKLLEIFEFFDDSKWLILLVLYYGTVRVIVWYLIRN